MRRIFKQYFIHTFFEEEEYVYKNWRVVSKNTDFPSAYNMKNPLAITFKQDIKRITAINTFINTTRRENMRGVAHSKFQNHCPVGRGWWRCVTAVRATGFLEEVPVYAWINSSQVSQNLKVHLMRRQVSLEIHRWEACILRVEILWRVFTLAGNQSRSDHLLLFPIHKHSQMVLLWKQL